MLISRFVPIIAPIAFAGSLAVKKPTPVDGGDLANGYDHVWFRPAGHDPPDRGPALPAGGRAWTSRGTLRADPLWRLDDGHGNQHEITTPRDKEREHVQHAHEETARVGPTPEELKLGAEHSRRAGLFDPELLKTAFGQSLVMLRPDIQWKNPVMFVVEVGMVLTIIYTIAKLFGYPSAAGVGYLLALDFWLLATLLFANFASAIAEARGKAQADALRKTRRTTPAAPPPRRMEPIEQTVSTELRAGDKVEVSPGEVIPSDGEIIEGVASIDESAITGESAPVIREAGGDRSGVTGGTRVLSDRIVVEITASPGELLPRPHDRPGRRGASANARPTRSPWRVVLAVFTLIFLIVTATLWPIAYNVELYMKDFPASSVLSLGTDVPTLVALLVCLIPTTIGALLAAIGIAGMDRALRANIMAKSGKAVEVAGDIDTLLLDKTGTITVGNRRATQFMPFDGFTAAEVGRLAAQALGRRRNARGQEHRGAIPSACRLNRRRRRTERT